MITSYDERISHLRAMPMQLNAQARLQTAVGDSGAVGTAAASAAAAAAASRPLPRRRTPPDAPAAAASAFARVSKAKERSEVPPFQASWQESGCCRGSAKAQMRPRPCLRPRQPALGLRLCPGEAMGAPGCSQPADAPYIYTQIMINDSADAPGLHYALACRRARTPSRIGPQPRRASGT
jgi:hypothetical protein